MRADDRCGYVTVRAPNGWLSRRFLAGRNAPSDLGDRLHRWRVAQQNELGTWNIVVYISGCLWPHWRPAGSSL
jgi:hypothetical protein